MTAAPIPNDAPAKTTKTPSRARRWLGRRFAIVLGIVLALAITEMVFRHRDDGAFAHLNCYDADDELGVALEPNCTTRVRVATNAPADVHIGADGFRGPALGEPTGDEILVLGDSQTFGLGVGDDETFAAVLGALLRRPVINAGVPTYGPLEYTEVARRVFSHRHPHTVVYVVNMANDFFEHSRPDRERHGVWDHWAVRRETMPAHVDEFPGREWLFQSSHAFLALRRALHQSTGAVDATRDIGFPSEGSLHDLVQAGDDTEVAHHEADEAHRTALAEHTTHLTQLAQAAAHADYALDEAIENGGWRDPTLNTAEVGTDLRGAYDILQYAHGTPGDIVSIDDGEDSRDTVVTAGLLAQARALRRGWIARDVTRHADGEIAAAVSAEAAAQAAYDAEAARVVDESVVPSVLDARLREIVDLCTAHGAELVVVALPLDVLVSDAEFAKYGAEPRDVSASRVVLTDLASSAERMGARAIDVTDALRAAEPGAFLAGDLHLSRSGHAAVAEAVRARLAGPVPVPRPGSGLPAGRSPTPTPDTLRDEPESSVAGSTAAGCVTHLVHEWLHVSCRDAGRNHPTGVTLALGGHGEGMTVTTDEAATLLVPIFAGDDLAADFDWRDRTQRLTVHWPHDASAPTVAFGDAQPAARATASVTESDARLCACHEEVVQGHQCSAATDEYGEPVCHPSCVDLYGQAFPECMTQFHDDCASLLRCARGDPTARPTCAEGTAPALAIGRCLPLCAPAAPGRDAVACASGTCTEWQGGHVCVP